jgi:hypothetical protein
MYPSSTPLVPDDQFHERDFAPRDLDAERDLQRMRRPQRQTAMKKPSLANRTVRSVSRFFRRGSDWRCAYAGRAILQRAVKRDDRGLGAVIGFAVAGAKFEANCRGRRLIGSSAAG